MKQFHSHTAPWAGRIPSARTLRRMYRRKMEIWKARSRPFMRALRQPGNHYHTALLLATLLALLLGWSMALSAFPHTAVLALSERMRV